jgi:cytochrome c553
MTASAWLAVLVCLARPQAAPADDLQGVEFFEKKIRPVLADQCYSCHSAGAKKVKGGLTLDSRAGALKGGNQGPAIRPGEPERSLLVRAIRWEDEDLQMPPKERLSAAVVKDFEEWVRRGAPGAPDWAGAAKAPSAAPSRSGMSVEEGRSFWAFRPPARTEPPAVRDASWPAGEVDRFILARLEARGLRPAPDADPATLLRRVFYDLTGLPPTPEDVDPFVRDPSPEAYARVVDALLASPRFGERWGRHWLDVARYAESLTLRGFILKEAWRYRDYVIRAFNEDLPFDQFIREQVAGDLLGGESLEERRRRRVAVSFLLLGNTNLEEQDKKQLEMDVVDEQIDAIGRGFLALTISCARCHDHKFDPIPTRDYYALAGILKNARVLEHANVSKWIEEPLPMEPALEEAARRHEEAVARLQARLKEERARAGKAARAAAEMAGGAVPVSAVPGIVVDDAAALKVGEWQASTYTGTYIGAGYLHDENSGKGRKSLTFDPDLPSGVYDVRFAYAPGENRATAVPVTILSAEGEKTLRINQREIPPLAGRFVSLGRYRFENNQGYVLVSNEGTDGHVTADAVVFLPADRAEEARGAAGAQDEVRRLEAELKKLQESAPPRDMVMALREEKEARDLRIHVRGSVHALGEVAPRGFLQVACPGPPTRMPSRESGRRELAEWLASRENPLTARVFVNRAWHWLFGAGIVRTPDNFGVTGERPSHPELLDWLAARFMDEGWSVKKLVRRMVLSRAYRMSSEAPLPAPEADPENRWLGRMNRRRLEAECLRDTILWAAGTLRLDAAGRTFPASLSSDYGYVHAGTERSVYVPVFRNALPEIFQAFDFADPSVPTGRRDAVTVAPQALLFMNSPFVRAQAERAARRLLEEVPGGDRERAVRAWRLALGRPPSESEAALAVRHAAAAGDARAAWADLFQALFASVEFRYVR